MLLLLDVRVTGNAERLEKLVASGQGVQVPDGMTSLTDGD